MYNNWIPQICESRGRKEGTALLAVEEKLPPAVWPVLGI